MTIDEKTLERIVALVSKELTVRGADTSTFSQCVAGEYEDVNEAVDAAYAAQKQLLRMTLADRKSVV